jgi:Zn-dependent peptidase ImmA (M78 family)
LEALRSRLNKRLVYVACDPESEGDGPPLKFAQYIDQAIELRNDLSFSEESMAIAHELGHVCLHPERGSIADITGADFDQEERVLQITAMLLAEKLELGDYREFATKWGFTHFAPETLTAVEYSLAVRVANEMLDMIESLEPQAADDYYEGEKEAAPVYVRDG